MSSFDFEIDFKAFEKALETAEEAVIDGAINGVDDALEYWQITATNLAPIGRYKGRRGGNLRAKIDHKTPKVDADGISGSVVANAFSNGFNYAYYLHNVAADKGASAQEPGTVLDFLEKAKNDGAARMQRLIEDAIDAEVKRKGLT
ncbi:hypothetical protein [Paenibacillus chibensis]|uniref:hypothetical protein n=1 Tax=Paenibacillus chibensis TaxID=59846 RepID=UPI000FD7D51D|nr:hypothetical protein [Paenibacillus chibensis]MEC0370046.1 hypothetical protein [Paenibacillus chibensis]